MCRHDRSRNPICRSRSDSQHPRKMRVSEEIAGGTFRPRHNCRAYVSSHGKAKFTSFALVAYSETEMRISKIIIAVVTWVGAHTAAGAACQGTAILFQDSFDRLQPTWGE